MVKRILVFREAVFAWHVPQTKCIEEAEYPFWRRFHWIRYATDPADERDIDIEEVRRLDESPKGWRWKPKKPRG